MNNLPSLTTRQHEAKHLILERDILDTMYERKGTSKDKPKSHAASSMYSVARAVRGVACVAEAIDPGIKTML